MSFQFSESHVEEFNTQGFTVFRGILPPSLIDDLRRACDRCRELARIKHGPQAQRLQPLEGADVDLSAFEDYRDLPELRHAVSRVLSPRHQHGQLKWMGVLFEPADEPWCTQWHRDWRDNVRGLDLDQWEADRGDIDYFNQVNCALYEDSCTWVVPGSHRRKDTPEEIARFPERPILAPELDGQSAAARERTCLDYCESMPGAQRLFLNAGDFALYRNVLWHIGNYVPYKRRSTIHDYGMTLEYGEWADQQFAGAHERVAAGADWENPYHREVTAVLDGSVAAA